MSARVFLNRKLFDIVKHIINFYLYYLRLNFKRKMREMLKNQFQKIRVSNNYTIGVMIGAGKSTLSRGRRPSGLRKTKPQGNSLDHKTTWPPLNLKMFSFPFVPLI